MKAKEIMTIYRERNSKEWIIELTTRRKIRYFVIKHFNESDDVDQFHEFIVKRDEPYSLVVRTAPDETQSLLPVQFLDIDDGVHKIHIKASGTEMTRYPMSIMAEVISNFSQVY